MAPEEFIPRKRRRVYTLDGESMVLSTDEEIAHLEGKAIKTSDEHSRLEELKNKKTEGVKEEERRNGRRSRIVSWAGSL